MSWRGRIGGCLLLTDRSNGATETWLHSQGVHYRLTRSSGAAYCLSEAQVEKVKVVIVEMRHDAEAIAAVPLIQRAAAIGHLPILLVLSGTDSDVERKARNLGAFGCVTHPIDYTAFEQMLHAASTLRGSSTTRAKQSSADTAQAVGAMLAKSSFSISTPSQAAVLAEMLASACPDPGRRLCGIHELLLNAIEHGNLGISGETKARLLFEGMWPQEVSRRLDLSEHAGKRVTVYFERDERRVVLRIVDEGAGFNWRVELAKELADVTGPSGRGIALARLLSFDELRYNEVGNEAIAVIYLSPADRELNSEPAPLERSTTQLPGALPPLEWVGLWLDVDYAVNAASDTDFYAAVLRLTLQRTQSRLGFFGYLNDDGKLMMAALDAERADAPQVGPPHVAVARDGWFKPWIDVVLRREAVLRHNDERSTECCDVLHASVAVPVMFRGELVGVLHVANRVGGYDTHQLELVTLIAQRVAPALVAHVERERYQRKLLAAQEVANAAAEQARFFAMSQDFMVVTDERVRYANPAYVRALGWTEAELQAMPIDELIHPDDREVMRAELAARLSAPGKEHQAVRIRSLTKSGASRTIEWTGIASHDGVILAIGRDVSPLTNALQLLSTENSEMRRVHEMLAHEQALAGEMLANIRSRGCLNSPWFRYVSSPLSFFNGDIVLADQTPTGEVRWILGDFTGHGLSAAIGTTPVASAFYATTRKGVPLPEVIATLNDLLRSLLPSGLFCAVTLLSLDATRTQLRVWNGGLPPVLIRRPHRPLRRVVSQGLPLGLVPSAELEVLIDTLSVDAEDEVYVYSDGLSEIANMDGKMFGSPRIEEALLRADHQDGFDRLLADVSAFRGATHAVDDVSLVQLKVGAVVAPSAERRTSSHTTALPLKGTGG